MLQPKQVYEYSGPVIVDGQRVTWKWTARTWAVSPQKARSNLIHRFKEQNNLCYRNNVVLDGDVIAYEIETSSNFEPKTLTVNEFGQLALDI